jgi:hypothetical protein
VNIHEGINKPFVTANGTAAVLESMEERLELVKIYGIGFVRLLLAPV